MRFTTEARFRGVTLPELEELYFDEAFNIAMCRDNGLQRQVLSLDKKDGRLSRRLKIGPERELPAPIKKVIGSDRLEYEERLEYTFGSYEARWVVVPGVLASKVRSEGTIRFRADRDAVVRTAAGEVEVKILGVGGMIEKVIIGDVERSFVNAAGFTQRWIDQEKHKKV
jgi:hypothetical protein